jgi:DNA-directed RNA polymerase specialized sigma24 family protein
MHEYGRTRVVANGEAFLSRTVHNLAIRNYRRERRIARASETVEQLDQAQFLVDSAPGVVLPHVILLPEASLMMLPEGLGIPFRCPLTD